MKSKLTKMLTLITIATPCLLGIATFTQPAPAYAATDPVCSSNVAEEVKKAAGCPGYATGDKLPSAVTIILNSIIAVSGLIAVAFVVIGGINFMTSNGDAAKLKKAKDTILYAVIGMIICVLAFAIVNFVIIDIIGGGSTQDNTKTSTQTQIEPETNTQTQEDDPSSYKSKAKCENAGYNWDKTSNNCVK